MSSPTQRSLKYLRDKGYIAEVVERWIPRVNIRKDFLGAFDVLALRGDEKGVLGVQVTSSSNASQRASKLRDLDAVKVWVQNGNRAIVHSWGKRGARGKRKTWQVREIDLTLELCVPSATTPESCSVSQ